MALPARAASRAGATSRRVAGIRMAGYPRMKFDRSKPIDCLTGVCSPPTKSPREWYSRLPSGVGAAACPSTLRSKRAAEAAGAPVGVEQAEQIERDQRVGDGGEEIVGRVVAVADDVVDVA